MPDCKPDTKFVWDHVPLAKHYEVRLDNEAGDRAVTATWEVRSNFIYLAKLLENSNLMKLRRGILVVVAVGEDYRRADAVIKNISFDFSKLEAPRNLRIENAQEEKA